jgi:AraC family transcriptional regulator
VAPALAQSILPQAIVAQGRFTRRDDRPAVITSQVHDWPGLLVEAGKNNVAEVDDLLTGQHYVSLNVDTKPYTYEVKEAHGFRRVTVPPQTMWVLPSAEPITLRLDTTFSYVRMSIDGRYLGRLIGRPDDAPVRLRRAPNLDAPEIASLMKTLVAEADGRNPGGLAVIEAVSTAIAHLLVRHVGVEPVRQEPARGGLSPMVRRRALAMIESRLDARLTVETLAREVDLSPAHFARAFKETMGRAPHQYLLSLRLERARRMLEARGSSLSAVAQRWGFADQAHFTRLFKRTYGVTPGAFVRQRNR